MDSEENRANVQVSLLTQACACTCDTTNQGEITNIIQALREEPCTWHASAIQKGRWYTLSYGERDRYKLYFFLVVTLVVTVVVTGVFTGVAVTVAAVAFFVVVAAAVVVVSVSVAVAAVVVVDAMFVIFFFVCSTFFA